MWVEAMEVLLEGKERKHVYRGNTFILREHLLKLCQWVQANC